MECSPDQSVVWLSIAREAFAHSNTASEAASALERLGRQAGLGGAFALGLQELVAYASAASDRAQDAFDAELEAVAASRRIVCPLLEAKLQARLDALDAQLRGKCSCSECGKVMQSEGRPKRSWDSLVGQLSLKRRQTECGQCKRHEFPAQRAIGLGDGDFTPRLEEAVTMMATTVPYGLAAKVVASLCGIEVSVKGIEQMVERRAERVLELDDEQARGCNPFDEKGLPVVEQIRAQDVKHRLWEVAHALYGEHSARASEWARVQCARVEQGEARQVVQALRFLHPSGAQAHEKLQELIGYCLQSAADRSRSRRL